MAWIMISSHRGKQNDIMLSKEVDFLITNIINIFIMRITANVNAEEKIMNSGIPIYTSLVRP